MAKKKTVWERLEAEGVFESQRQALPWVMAGSVMAGQSRVTSLMEKVEDAVPITVKGREMKYVSKGGLKLEGAIQDFGINVKGRVCIDAGACTGGFTDCFLQHGAEKVYAVEVGFGQLSGALRQNPRVVNLEKTNISDDKLLTLDPVPDLAGVDLSYLSLIKAVPAFRKVMRGGGEMICLVKPLFEVEDSRVRRTGVIDQGCYEAVLMSVIERLNGQDGTRAVNVTHSHVTGNNGTHEFFLHVVLQQGAPPDLTGKVQAAIKNVLSLTKFKK